MSLPLSATDLSTTAVTLPVNVSDASSPPVSRRIDWLASIPFFGVHVFTIVAMFFVDYSWKWVGLAIASYYLRMFAITAGYHRYFSHRTYSMGRVSRFLMGFLGTACTQKGPLWWASHHRHHHRYSDQKEDLHSPVRDGFWYSHLGWILSNENSETRWALIKDLSRFPELVWLNRYYLVAPVLYAALCFALGGWNALVWGYFLSTVLLWHGTFTINSLCHVWGVRTYRTEDTSRNNFVLALITLGEGWHNNHHCYMNSVNQGFRWWQVDPSYYVLRVGSWFGLFSKLKMAPLQELESKKFTRS